MQDAWIRFARRGRPGDERLPFVLLAFAWGVPAALAAGVLAYLAAWCLRPR